MSSSTAALSHTLKTITLTKIKELEKQRKSYARAKDVVLEAACQSDTDPVEKIRCLLKGVEDLGPKTDSKMPLTNIRCWLEQSQFDSSFPDVKLKEFEVQLRSELDIQSRKLDLAALYSRLLTEWLSSTNSQEVDAGEGIPSLDGPFELVEKDRLKQLTDQFSKVVFTPLETNSDKITDYLNSLFQDHDSAKALDIMRKKVESFGKLILEAKPFGEHSIQWCLKGLLANDLLRDDKKRILQEFGLTSWPKRKFATS